MALVALSIGYSVSRTDEPKPNIHDTEEFSLVYNHSDGYGTGGSGPPTLFPFGEQAGLQTIVHATMVSDYIHQ